MLNTMTIVKLDKLRTSVLTLLNAKLKGKNKRRKYILPESFDSEKIIVKIKDVNKEEEHTILRMDSSLLYRNMERYISFLKKNEILNERYRTIENRLL